ncbi:MAG: ATP-binding protein [Thermoflexibacter sp.]|jgi:hypothetical protein|nr:ATP-binding protein [Thermoflexibacter sp.]
MQIRAGQIARGKNFFQRKTLIKLLYRRLNAGADLYIAAPRRMGKSSLMRYLEDQKDDNFIAIYATTEAIDDAENFYKELLMTLEKSDLVRTKAPKVLDFLTKIDFKLKLKFAVGEAEIGKKDNKSQTTFYQDFKELVEKLDNDTATKIVVMIDEFPQTVKNILDKSGEKEAIRFLQSNREIRQKATENISFVLTGSIGLTALTEKLNASQTTNDLTTFEVPPLDREEAKELATALLEGTGMDLPINPQTWEHLLQRVTWFNPFFIQLICQELVDELDRNEQIIDISMIDRAIESITDRKNDQYFAHYYERLHKSYNQSEANFAKEVLNLLCKKEEISTEEINEIAKKHGLAENYPVVLRSLEFDGYLFPVNEKRAYRFTSPILQLWWKKYI